MNKLQALLGKAALQLPEYWCLEPTTNGAVLTLPNGRTQRVRLGRQGDWCVLSSVVLGRQRVERLDRHDLITWLWTMNRELGVVGLMLDRQGRLVGRIEQPLNTLDAAELALYLQLLARECDRLEYILSGHDIS